MKYLYAMIAFLLASTPSALAADYSVKFGPSIQEGTTDGSSKMFGVRQDAYLFYGVYSGVELGGYVDNGGHGRKSAGFAKAQIGVKPGPTTGVYGFGFFGPCGITSTDSQLGSSYQFATDLGLGVRDATTFMSAGYGHISNAGLKLPNHGRDYLLFSVGLSI